MALGQRAGTERATRTSVIGQTAQCRDFKFTYIRSRAMAGGERGKLAQNSTGKAKS